MTKTTRPLRFLSDPAAAASVVERFAQRPVSAGTGYATVRDYCDSMDLLPQITAADGDLKNVQRPWAVKTLLGLLPPPARLLEIGGGEPIVSGFLSELGYEVTLVDPYDGSGNGPTEYQRYLTLYPHVRLVRAYLAPGMREFKPGSFDAIFSVSVLEHVPAEPLRLCYQAIRELLRPGGASVHCFDFILQGAAADAAAENARQILGHQNALAARADDDGELARVCAALTDDLETFFLSPQGHHHWRGGQPYETFPFRKVVSLQTIATRSESRTLETE